MFEYRKCENSSQPPTNHRQEKQKAKQAAISPQARLPHSLASTRWAIDASQSLCPYRRSPAPATVRPLDLADDKGKELSKRSPLRAIDWIKDSKMTVQNLPLLFAGAWANFSTLWMALKPLALSCSPFPPTRLQGPCPSTPASRRTNPSRAPPPFERWPGLLPSLPHSPRICALRFDPPPLPPLRPLQTSRLPCDLPGPWGARPRLFVSHAGVSRRLRITKVTPTVTRHY